MSFTDYERKVIETAVNWTRHGGTCHRFGPRDAEHRDGYYKEQVCTCGYDALASLIWPPELVASLGPFEPRPASPEEPRT